MQLEKIKQTGDYLTNKNKVIWVVAVFWGCILRSHHGVNKVSVLGYGHNCFVNVKQTLRACPVILEMHLISNMFPVNLE